MNPDATAVVRQSWTELSTDAERFADRFITRLVDLDAGLSLLLVDPGRAAAARRLLGAAEEVMGHLDDPDRLVVQFIGLGRELGDWGIRPHDFDSARGALFGALYETLGARFTAEMDDAWHELFAIAAAVMLRAGPRTPEADARAV